MQRPAGQAGSKTPLSLEALCCHTAAVGASAGRGEWSPSGGGAAGAGLPLASDQLAAGLVSVRTADAYFGCGFDLGVAGKSKLE